MSSPSFLNQRVADEKLAIIGGLLGTALLGLPLLFVAILSLRDIVSSLIPVLAYLWVIGMTTQYWVAASYKDGMTVKELLLAVFWPVDIIRAIREGVHHEQGLAGLRPQNVPSSQDTSKTLLDEAAAKIAGYVFIALSILCGLLTIVSVLSMLGSFIWLMIAVYVLGFITQYWVSRAPKDGLTGQEILMAVLWPVDMVGIIRKGVKHRQDVRRAA